MGGVRYTIGGVGLRQCADRIVREVSRVEGVTEVSVNVNASTVTVRGAGVEGKRVRSVIDEAGGSVAGAVGV